MNAEKNLFSQQSSTELMCHFLKEVLQSQLNKCVTVLLITAGHCLYFVDLHFAGIP